MKTIRKHGELFTLFLFSFLFFFIFKYGPLYGVIIAFKDFRVVDGVWGSAWVGLQHFQFGGEPVFYMGKKEYFRSIVVVSAILKDLGWGSIIYFAALSGINPELQESAIIDGANRWQRIIKINIPSIMPTVAIMFILSLGGFLSANFEQIINMLNPVTYETGDVIDTYVYRVGLQQFQYSYTAAIGLFKSLVGLLLILGANLTVRKLSRGESGLW
ncbi:ABC transporter permease subunit [Paenibacillus sp. MCAF20]